MQSVKSFKVVLIVIFATLPFTGFAQSGATTNKGLKDYYKDYFPIGAAIRPQDVTGPVSELILAAFNSITAENAMKMGPIHPKENEYNWEPADRIAALPNPITCSCAGTPSAGTIKPRPGCSSMTKAIR